MRISSTNFFVMSRRNLIQRDSQIYFVEPIRHKINKKTRYSLQL